MITGLLVPVKAEWSDNQNSSKPNLAQNVMKRKPIN